MGLRCWLGLTHWHNSSTSCQFCRKEGRHAHIKIKMLQVEPSFPELLADMFFVFSSSEWTLVHNGRKHTQSHKPVFQKEITYLWGEEVTSIAVRLLSGPLSSQWAVSAGPSIIGFLSRLSSQSPMVLFVP